jgi:uncharacterized protein (DUF885 family)
MRHLSTVASTYRIRAVTALAVILLALFPAHAQAQSSRANQASKALHALFAAEWDYQMEQSPTRASTLGDRRWNDRWPDQSMDAIRRRAQHHVQVLGNLAKIKRDALPAADQLNYDLFKRDYEPRVEYFRHRWFLLPLDQLGGVHTINELAENQRAANQSETSAR